jgi:hypothetical protein
MVFALFLLIAVTVLYDHVPKQVLKEPVLPICHQRNLSFATHRNYNYVHSPFNPAVDIVDKGNAPYKAPLKEKCFLAHIVKHELCRFFITFTLCKQCPYHPRIFVSNGYRSYIRASSFFKISNPFTSAIFFSANKSDHTTATMNE